MPAQGAMFSFEGGSHFLVKFSEAPDGLRLSGILSVLLTRKQLCA